MFLKLFKKEEKRNPHRDVRDLLRENLNLLPVDMFYLDDPLNELSPEGRILYLKTFADIYTDKKLCDRIKYQINRQAQLTLAKAQTGTEDQAGAMNINGMAFVLDEIARLANMYLLETTKPKEQPLDKFSIIPKMES